MFWNTSISMKRNFEQTAKRISSEDKLASQRRAHWPGFEKRINAAFLLLDSDKKTSSAFGGIYLTSAQNYPPYSDNPKINSKNSLNQVQISVGNRFSWIYKNNGQGKAEILYEVGSALWFSQDLSGGVTAFLSPYKSQHNEVTEKNVIIKRYKSPEKITNKEIEKLFNKFIKYCEATLHFSAQSRRLYFFRLCLQFKDIRNRQRINRFLTKTAGQSLAFFLAAMGVLATLYTGGVFSQKVVPETVHQVTDLCTVLKSLENS